MNEYFRSIILNKTGASSIIEKEIIQELWSGYGKIIRIGLVDSPLESVVVKYVQLPTDMKHPRGWHSDIGHQRKINSYKVEAKWYDTYSSECKARLPACLGIDKLKDELILVLEDIDVAGYPYRKRSVDWEEICYCLKWLAQFHATYLGRDPDGLWKVGTYWHLATRPHELSVLDDKRLKEAAVMIDSKLNACKYKTIVHGDAKLANFCFAQDGRVAGVDFQYVGGGCGMKDVAYFVGSCMDEKDCERLEAKILDVYFTNLQSELENKNEALESEWRSLYRVAWADFHRFLKGWSPTHWKINGYSERITAEVIKNI